MSKGIKAIIAIFLVVGIFGGVIGTVLSHRMDLINLSERVDAQYVDNQSNYDNMWKSFKEMTQVTDLQAEHFKDTYTALISGRYEVDGEQKNLMFKFIQEQNPQLGTEIYLQLSDKIASGRKEFAEKQRIIADIIREYNVMVQKYFIVAPMLGFTVKNAEDYIVTSVRTEEAFDTGKDDVVNLR